MKFASLFSGFGLADIGARSAGCELIWGIELDEGIAEVSRQLGHRVLNQSVVDTDWHSLEKPDILWASPPCPNFSIAKKGATETVGDLLLSVSVGKAITVLNPKYFILENVQGYRNSGSLKFIEEELIHLGYWVDKQVINSADFGVPQTRRRLILRAVKDEFVPPLPQPESWQGWYDAIADLIPTLPETQFAQWHLDRLPEWLTTYFCDGKGTEEKIRGKKDEKTLRTGTESVHRRAVFLDVVNTIRNCTVRESHEPSITITAEKMRRPSSTPKALLNDGRVVQMTSRCLARFQTLPDWYDLPQKNTSACKGIGNGVPCLLAEKIVRSLLVNQFK